MNDADDLSCMYFSSFLVVDIVITFSGSDRFTPLTHIHTSRLLTIPLLTDSGQRD